ncbi:hypothetical protein CRT23_16145 [Methylobacterium sp. V23]|nr:hypothetical protein CRT23_16145 [Methylobacterium sp. V23]
MERPTHLSRVITGFSVAVVVVLCAMTGGVVLNMREHAWSQATLTSETLLRSAERTLDRDIELYDLSLQAVVERLQSPELEGISPEVRRLALFDRASSAPGFGSIFVLDEHGQAYVDSHSVVPRRLNASDRRYFRIHRDRADLGLHLGRPMRSGVSGRFVLPLSRRVSYADGSFAGVVIGTIEIAYFTEIFRRLNTEAKAAINLFHDDGVLLVRTPADSLLPGRDMSSVASVQRFIREDSGQLIASSSMDGVDRLYTFKRVGRWPLRINVALSIASINEAWRPKALSLALVLVAMCAATSVLSVFLHRELRRRISAEDAAEGTRLELVRLASTDALTGLANRRQFDEALAAGRAEAGPDAMALLLFDTDRFKRYNDLYGHLAGDRVLKAIAATLMREARATGGLACRIGGEEFALILSPATEAEALACAERVRQAIVAEGMPHAGQDHGVVTVSCGVVHAAHGPGLTTEAWFEAADVALYEAKRQGRNRVLVAGARDAGSPACAPTAPVPAGSSERVPQADADAEGELQRILKRYTALIDASASTVWRAGPDGRIIDSGGWERQTGQDQGAAGGDGWLDVVHPEDRTHALSAWRRITATAETGVVEYRARHASGGYRWISARAVPLKDETGRLVEWVGVATDIHEARQATEALRIQEERHRLAVRATRDAVWDWDLTTDETQWSEAAPHLFGEGDSGSDQGGASWAGRIHPDDRARVLASVQEAVGGPDDRWDEAYRFLRVDDTYAEVIDRGFIVRDEAGRALRMVGAMHDVTEQREANSALRSSEERLRLALQAGRMVAWERDMTTGLATRSANAMALLGIGSGSIALLIDQVHPADRPQVENFVAYGGTAHAVEFRYFHPAGPMMWLIMRADRVTDDRIVGITFDITDRKRAEEHAWSVAHHDGLTGLANRAFFLQQLEAALTEAERAGACVSLLLIDLDGFKDVNETLGHDVGDAVLVEVAQRLRAGLGPRDAVARLGGDEFALLLTEAPGLAHAVPFASTLLERLRAPLSYRGRALTCKASIGITAFPDHHRDGLELLKDADIALDRAKASGRNRAVVFDPSMRAETEHRVGLIAEIRAGIDAGAFVPFYQPKVCLRTGAVVGFEALARWQHPTHGLVTPGYFGLVFEDPELATALGDCLIRQIAADMRSWHGDALAFGRVAVNFASAEFRKADLAGHVLAVLEQFQVPAAAFELEITETVFLGQGSHCVPQTLQRLHDAGVMVTLDDFGTGFASLTHLKQFPVGHIKVDQSFVRNMEKDPDDAAIVAAVIGLGHSLDLQVTAEGIETRGQAEQLVRMGCDYAQGYLYAKPMIGARIPWFLRNWTGAAQGAPEAQRASA